MLHHFLFLGLLDESRLVTRHSLLHGKSLILPVDPFARVNELLDLLRVSCQLRFDEVELDALLSFDIKLFFLPIGEGLVHAPCPIPLVDLGVAYLLYDGATQDNVEVVCFVLKLVDLLIRGNLHERYKLCEISIVAVPEVLLAQEFKTLKPFHHEVDFALLSYSRVLAQNNADRFLLQDTKEARANLPLDFVDLALGQEVEDLVLSQHRLLLLLGNGRFN